MRLGQTGRAGLFLAGLGGEERERGEIRVAAAEVELARGNPSAALAELAALKEGLGSGEYWGFWQVWPAVLEAITRDALGDPDAADTALEHALDCAEPDGVLLPFLLFPVPRRLLERHARHGTAHTALVADILSLLAGRKLAPPPAGPPPPLEPLSDSEIRVLRYLPTNLSGPEIAGELNVSYNTVSTHLRHLYAKLGTHTRAETVARARALGLLAPSPHRGQATRPG
jgi:LuxR family maltose regulon positive regulatory protein